MHINNVRSSRTGKTANPTRHPRRGKIHGVIAGLLSFVLPRHSARVFTGRQRTSRRPCGRLTDKKKTCYNENQKHNVSTKKKRHDLNEPHPGYVQPRRRHTERIRKKKSLTFDDHDCSKPIVLFLRSYNMIRKIKNNKNRKRHA